MGSSNAKVGPARTTVIKQVASGNGAAAAAAFASSKAHSHVIRAICAAGQTVYIGRASDVANVTTTALTYPLRDGEFLVVENTDLAEYCHFADAVGARIAIIDASFY